MATTTSTRRKSKFRAQDKRLLNWYYGRVFKTDVLKSIQHANQEEKRITENNVFKRFSKWLQQD